MKGERLYDKMQLPFPCFVNYNKVAKELIPWCEDNIDCKWGYFLQSGGTVYIYITEDIYRVAYKLRW